MNSQLLSILKANIGLPLNAELAADIMLAADQVPTLVPFDAIERINPEAYGEFTFAVEHIEEIVDEIKPLHRAHWQETEAHRHGLEFNMDYETLIRHERAGRYILFALRCDGRLLGNCGAYLNRSVHTQTFFATEDTFYLSPEARKGRVASRFLAYVEKALCQLGVREIDVSVKVVNKAGRFFRMLGYKHVEDGLNKILEAEDVLKSA